MRPLFRRALCRNGVHLYAHGGGAYHPARQNLDLEISNSGHGSGERNEAFRSARRAETLRTFIQIAFPARLSRLVRRGEPLRARNCLAPTLLSLDAHWGDRKPLVYADSDLGVGRSDYLVHRGNSTDGKDSP